MADARRGSACSASATSVARSRSPLPGEHRLVAGRQRRGPRRPRPASTSSTSVAEVVAGADIVVVAAALPALDAVVDQVAEAVGRPRAVADHHRRGQREGADRGSCRGGAPGPVRLRAGPPAGRHRAVGLGQRRRPSVRRHHLGPVGGRAGLRSTAGSRWPGSLCGLGVEVVPVDQRRARPHPRPHQPPALRAGRAASPAAPTPRPLAALRRVAGRAHAGRVHRRRRPLRRRAGCSQPRGGARPRSTGSSTTSSTARDDAAGTRPARGSAPRSSPMPSVELGATGPRRRWS